MMEFFREELSHQQNLAQAALRTLDNSSGDEDAKEDLLRSFHSLKGACVLVGLEPGERLMRNLEIQFEISGPNKELTEQTFALLSSLSLIESEEELSRWKQEHSEKLADLQQEETQAPATPPPGLADLSILDVFLTDLERQKDLLLGGLLSLSKAGVSSSQLEVMMRAAHSIKGASAMVGLEELVPLAHAIEDSLESTPTESPREVQDLLKALDIFASLEKLKSVESAKEWLSNQSETISELVAELQSGEASTPAKPAVRPRQSEELADRRTLKIDTDFLDELMALAGELEVTTHWLQPFESSIHTIKQNQRDILKLLESPRHSSARLEEIYQSLSLLIQKLDERAYELNGFERRLTRVSGKFNQMVVSARMRPLSDIQLKLSRLVHDLERELNKSIDFEIRGSDSLVDRDVLQRLETVLVHLIVNSLDHGIEDKDTRRALNKPERGHILIEARHRGGRFHLTVEDDGRGVDPDSLRQEIVKRDLILEEAAQTLSEQELGDFLLLPRFTTKEVVSQISGRGVGLDIVREVVSMLDGQLSLQLRPGRGLKFDMTLPVTRSVTRALVVDICGQFFALPLGRVEEIVRFSSADIQDAGGRPYLVLSKGQVASLVRGEEILELRGHKSPSASRELNCVVLRLARTYFALLVDDLVGKKELVLQKLPELLGKVQDISAAATLEDGTVVMLLDLEDLLRTIENSLSQSPQQAKSLADALASGEEQTHILLVEDSLTVRELQRKILENQGYRVTVAVDGVDGWNALGREKPDLVVTDIDMPRMDGISLIKKIRLDYESNELPIIVISYKNREEDRQRGLAAGADRYLTKGSFRDDSFVATVGGLIGEKSL